MIELNFDALPGPTYFNAGLSAGNLASQRNAARVASPRAAALEADPIGELERLYRIASEVSRADATVAAACRAELAELQRGAPESMALWREFVAVSRVEAERVYQRLEVEFDTWLGESAYNSALPGVVERLLSKGLAQRSDDAAVVYFPAGSGLKDNPYIVQKSDGAYLYSTTDIATVEHRVREYGAQRIIYVVDIRQALHFRQLFETVRALGVEARLEHVGFGMMLGPDSKPFRTRDGGTIRLNTLLDEAEERVLPLVRARWADLDEAERRAMASRVGAGAVKYADLCQNLTSDYRFEWDKLLALDGNTGPYLQYTLVRVRSLLREHERRVGETGSALPVPSEIPEGHERDLAVHLVRFGDVLGQVEATLRPHLLCEYLYGLGRRFNALYAACPILTADADARTARLLLATATARVLDVGLTCLNIPRLHRM